MADCAARHCRQLSVFLSLIPTHRQPYLQHFQISHAPLAPVVDALEQVAALQRGHRGLRARGWVREERGEEQMASLAVEAAAGCFWARRPGRRPLPPPAYKPAPLAPRQWHPKHPRPPSPP